jgi:putative SOS response-associated peptidase YedK
MEHRQNFLTRQVCYSWVGSAHICNLYSITTNQEAMRKLFRAPRDRAGNLPPKYAVFPYYEAPVIRTDADGVRAIDIMRWGIPGPVQFGVSTAAGFQASVAE